MQTYEIRHRHTGAVLYSAVGESLRDVVDRAVRKRADLSGADFAGANLTGAHFAEANLTGADFTGARLAGAYFAYATLTGARLPGAYFSGAYFGGADLADATIRGGHRLVGKRPILQIGPVGSRGDLLTAYMTNAGVMIETVGFFGTLDAFREAVEAEHGDNRHGREYRAAIAMIEAHASLWKDSQACHEHERSVAAHWYEDDEEEV